MDVDGKPEKQSGVEGNKEGEERDQEEGAEKEKDTKKPELNGEASGGDGEKKENGDAEEKRKRRREEGEGGRGKGRLKRRGGQEAGEGGRCQAAEVYVQHCRRRVHRAAYLVAERGEGGGAGQGIRDLAQKARLLAARRHRDSRLWPVAGHTKRWPLLHHKRTLQDGCRKGKLPRD